MVFPKKGDIFLVNFDPTIGHEIKKKRPAVILSNNLCNQYSPLVTVAPLSSNISKIYPFEIFLSKEKANLLNDSKIMIIQMRSIDKDRLIKKLGTINDNQILSKIDFLIIQHFDIKIDV